VASDRLAFSVQEPLIAVALGRRLAWWLFARRMREARCAKEDAPPGTGTGRSASFTGSMQTISRRFPQGYWPPKCRLPTCPQSIQP